MSLDLLHPGRGGDPGRLGKLDTNRYSMQSVVEKDSPVVHDPDSLSDRKTEPILLDREYTALPMANGRKTLLKNGLRIGRSSLAKPECLDENGRPSIQVTPIGVFSIFWTSVLENEIVYEVNIQCKPNATVSDGIKKAITHINNLLGTQNKELRLKENEKLFELYCAKKNGKIKRDYPVLYADQVLNESGFNVLALKEKSLDSIEGHNIRTKSLEHNSPPSYSDEDSNPGCCACFTRLFSRGKTDGGGESVKSKDDVYDVYDDRTKPLLSAN